MFVLEVEGGWDVVGQLRLEFNLVDTWLEKAALDVKHTVLVLKELFAVLELISMMDSLVTILGRVMMDERAFLSSLELEFDVGGVNGLHNFQVDYTTDGITWLIEGVLRLELNSAFWELAPCI